MVTATVVSRVGKSVTLRVTTDTYFPEEQGSTSLRFVQAYNGDGEYAPVSILESSRVHSDEYRVVVTGVPSEAVRLQAIHYTGAVLTVDL